MKKVMVDVVRTIGNFYFIFLGNYHWQFTYFLIIFVIYFLVFFLYQNLLFGLLRYFRSYNLQIGVSISSQAMLI